MGKIRIQGKDYGLAYTVRSRIELGKICGGHTANDFFDSLGKDDQDTTEHIIDAVCVMHDAYERRKALEDGKEYTETEIPKDAFYDLSITEWTEIENAIVNTIREDSGIQIETAPVKKNTKASCAG